MLKPFKLLGIVFADMGYLSRKNFQLAMNKGGCAFIHFQKRNKKKSKGSPVWKFALNLYKICNWIYMNIYHQRSKIESVNSSIKKRFGDSFKCKRKPMRRKEVALRFVAYNVLIMLCYNYSVKHNLPLYVRA